MCKVAWLPIEKEESYTDNGVTLKRRVIEKPEPSKVPLTLLKQREPVKLLEFYERIYFRETAK